MAKKPSKRSGAQPSFGGAHLRGHKRLLGRLWRRLNKALAGLEKLEQRIRGMEETPTSTRKRSTRSAKRRTPTTRSRGARVAGATKHRRASK